MWIHIVVPIILLFLIIGAKTKRLRCEKYMSRQDFHRILLVIFIGNLIGAALNWQNNQGRILSSDTALARPEHGMGNDIQQFIINTGEQDSLSLSLSIPEQEGADADIDSEKALTPEESLTAEIRAAAAALNEEKQDPEKYYLPDEVNGTRIQWSYPIDHSGTILLSLSILAALLLIVSREREKEKQRQKRRDQMFLDYPNLVTKLCLLMQAGMTMRRAFSKTALDYRKYQQTRDVPRCAYEEMLITYYEMESGVLESQAYENFGRRCDHPQYRTLATLLSQNLKKGSRGLLEILERESLSAFEDRKRQAKIIGEAAATKLLIPMVLMLLVVLIILMVPACMSFYG